MAFIRDFKPNEGSERVSHEMIAGAAARGDVELLRLYASNLLWALEQLFPIAERARALSIELDQATQEMERW